MTALLDRLDLGRDGALLVAEVEAYLRAAQLTQLDVEQLVAEALRTPLHRPAPAAPPATQSLAWNAHHPLPQPTLLDRLRGHRPRADITPQQHLTLTSRYIHQHGWCQGQLWDREGAVCIRGAQLRVYLAGYGTTWTTTRAWQRLGNTLGQLGQPMPVDTWNDLPSTSLADIHQLLRTAAA
jgi:hypothetical protein